MKVILLHSHLKFIGLPQRNLTKKLWILILFFNTRLHISNMFISTRSYGSNSENRPVLVVRWQLKWL